MIDVKNANLLELTNCQLNLEGHFINYHRQFKNWTNTYPFPGNGLKFWRYSNESATFQDKLGPPSGR